MNIKFIFTKKISFCLFSDITIISSIIATNAYNLVAWAGHNPSAIEIDPIDGSVHTVSAGYIYNWSYDGTTALVQNAYANVGTDAFAMLAVPEPLTITLLGLGGVVLVRRRRA